MKIVDHYLDWATKSPSPNFSDRKNDIDLIVIHCISLPEGEYANSNIEDLFLNKIDCLKHDSFKSLEKLKVSSHLLVRRDGTVIQFVPFDKCAWHAGESSYDGRKNCNDFSIGIELEGCIGDIFTEQQYTELSAILKELKSVYGIKNIVGHSDIAPGRKLDPGENFNWERVADV
ncbi:MAG: 1,6-anhydro-N-acetylmuramyl-L-alanine amidase AmpD [Proteobacteria bacterium]|uniref:1,6-anhydro-N-acetylmuramyl-L-alanine amidase AmpD n=1 Tax=SAR86 cluster bacterium TaxID=2030880 RepID=A0A937IAN4_9GAMM|nr:1,6-anhydro-N-acetylmuramyl-L-alanine amidase AmpD [SAR86 cluster bacterium]MBL6820077.1 1,6-anhydro-N-acetylmuramyl-L-alanine amidase AmpD [SAR86 cluster bacterium]MDA0344934.1 1,6-anhydro-N-acetylmuramyl-L-alanine amidase AmpD [Pseudomonadota bacterium]MDA0899759.1 1,6-anhydro-N-acetylmuramyl-L-alanine amidase AmpD [Pseudomonadota bacterium]